MQLLNWLLDFEFAIEIKLILSSIEHLLDPECVAIVNSDPNHSILTECQRKLVKRDALCLHTSGYRKCACISIEGCSLL